MGVGKVTEDEGEEAGKEVEEIEDDAAEELEEDKADEIEDDINDKGEVENLKITQASLRSPRFTDARPR